MRLTTLKDLLVVASLFVGVAFAGASVVHGFDSPANDNVPATMCEPDTNAVSIGADDAPTVAAGDELHC